MSFPPSTALLVSVVPLCSLVLFPLAAITVPPLALLVSASSPLALRSHQPSLRALLLCCVRASPRPDSAEGFGKDGEVAVLAEGSCRWKPKYWSIDLCFFTEGEEEVEAEAGEEGVGFTTEGDLRFREGTDAGDWVRDEEECRVDESRDEDMSVRLFLPVEALGDGKEDEGGTTVRMALAPEIFVLC
jgi:hypothetical protein